MAAELVDRDQRASTGKVELDDQASIKRGGRVEEYGARGDSTVGG